jgi:4-diphosphocytidyl-2-C-methyl-D-erythritol kinase
LVNPQIHISTAEAYAGVKPSMPVVGIKEIIASPLNDWANVLKNDFEKKIIENHPKIGVVKDLLYKLGANYASMTGSGSTVFGIFESAENFPIDIFNDCICWQGECLF